MSAEHQVYQEWSAYCTDCNAWLNQEDGEKDDILWATFQHLKNASFREHIVYIGYRISSPSSHSNYLAFRFNHRVGQVADFMDSPGTEEEKIRQVLRKMESIESQTS